MQVVLEITVLAVNDHPPVFSPTLYHFYMYETEQDGGGTPRPPQLVGRVSATDRDGDTLSYNVTSSSTGPLFSFIDVSTFYKSL